MCVSNVRLRRIVFAGEAIRCIAIMVKKVDSKPRGDVLKKASSAISTVNKKVSDIKKTLIYANDNYFDTKDKETHSILKERHIKLVSFPSFFRLIYCNLS